MHIRPQAAVSLFRYSCAQLSCSVWSTFKEDLFVRSTVGLLSDSTTVFVQGPMVKHLALSKECFSSSPLKSVFICVPWVSGKMESWCRGTSQEGLLSPPPHPVIITLCCNLFSQFVCKISGLSLQILNITASFTFSNVDTKVEVVVKLSAQTTKLQLIARYRTWKQDGWKVKKSYTGY